MFLISMDFPTASSQERFMLMLLERVDKLTDDLEHLRQRVNGNLLSIPDIKHDDNRLVCNDIGCIGFAAFIRARLAGEDVVREFVDVLRDINGVNAFVYDSGLTTDYTENLDARDKYEIPDMQYGAYTIQALVCFTYSIVTSHICFELCKRFPREKMCKIELQPIYDIKNGVPYYTIYGITNGIPNYITEECLFKYYYYNIAAAIHGVTPALLTEGELEWIQKDGSIQKVFIGNNIYPNVYINLCLSLHRRNVTWSVFPWLRKCCVR
jgi:hypothetical protein